MELKKYLSVFFLANTKKTFRGLFDFKPLPFSPPEKETMIVRERVGGDFVRSTSHKTNRISQMIRMQMTDNKKKIYIKPYNWREKEKDLNGAEV